MATKVTGGNTPDSSEVTADVAVDEKAAKPRTNFVDRLVLAIATELKRLARTQDSDNVFHAAVRVLNTIMLMNVEDEYSLGLRVNGELYKFEDYRCPSAFANLVIAGKAVTEAIPSAKNFIKKNAYLVHGEASSPQSFLYDCRELCKWIRINPEFQSISRPSEVILTDVTQYAVVSGEVRSAEVPCLYFFTTVFDEETRVSKEEWIRSFVSRLLGSK